VLNVVQKAWLDQQVPQCGYCQSGMIMAVSALLAEKPHATNDEVDEAITNICRCGTFARVRKAIQSLTTNSEGGA
jgi:isoquinoline 1-oxidoreductase alpha subunit